MHIREPVVAGRFYPGDKDECERELRRLLAAPPDREQGDPGPAPAGGIVPHAGWVFSGDVAGLVFAELARRNTPSVVVLFGAVHRYSGRQAALFGAGTWLTPVGAVEVDAELATRVCVGTDLVIDEPAAHAHEHSIEVQVPLVKTAWPEAKILPVAVPPSLQAHLVGQAVAQILQKTGAEAIVIGTTDLTHYGSDYGFAPKGGGDGAVQWAKDDNDRRFIDLMASMQADRVVPEAATNRNACGSGAVAATIAACATLGATQGILCAHTCSAEVQVRLGMGPASNSVGYAGMVFS